MTWQEKTLVNVSSAEIRVQQFVFLLIVFPVAGLFFPAISFYWVVYAFITLAVQLDWVKESVHEGFLNNWIPFILVSILLEIGIYANQELES